MGNYPREEIEALEAQTASSPQKREAQRRLARELTLLVHGEEDLQAAERASAALFGGDLVGLTEAELLEIFADVPSKEMPRARLGQITAGEAFTESGLAKSRSEARRLIEGGGASIGNRRIDDAEQPVAATDLTSDTVAVLRAGKNRFALLRFTH